MAKNTLETAKPKAYGRRVKDIPQEYRISEIDYNKHANDVIYVDAGGKPIEGNPRETHDVSNVTWYTPQTKSAIYDDNEQQIAKSEQKRVERISKEEQTNQNIKDNTRTLADFTPVLGVALQAKDVYNTLRSGNRQEAGILLASLLVPNIIEKPLKYAGKAIYKGIKNYRATLRGDNVKRIESFLDVVKNNQEHINKKRWQIDIDLNKNYKDIVDTRGDIRATELDRNMYKNIRGNALGKLNRNYNIAVKTNPNFTTTYVDEFGNSHDVLLPYGTTDNIKIQPKTQRASINTGVFSVPRGTSDDLIKLTKERENRLNSLLQGKGKLAGSSKLASEGYSTHIPGDDDIITTQEQYKDLLNALEGTENRTLRDDVGYNISSKKLRGDNQDIDIIQTDPKTGMVTGKLAHEFYALMYPHKYNKLRNEISRTNALKELDDVTGLNTYKFDFADYPLDVTSKDLYDMLDNDIITKKSISDLLFSHNPKHSQRRLELLSNPKNAKLLNELIDSKHIALFGKPLELPKNFNATSLENKKFLEAYNLPEDIIDDKETMETLAKYYYLANGVHTRRTDLRQLIKPDNGSFEDVLNSSINTTYASKGGSTRGRGGNFTTGNQGGGSGYGDYLSVVSDDVNNNVSNLKDLHNRYNTKRHKLTEREKHILEEDFGEPEGNFDNLDDTYKLLTTHSIENTPEANAKIANAIDRNYLIGDEYYGNAKYIGRLKPAKLIGEVYSPQKLSFEHGYFEPFIPTHIAGSDKGLTLREAFNILKNSNTRGNSFQRDYMKVIKDSKKERKSIIKNYKELKNKEAKLELKQAQLIKDKDHFNTLINKYNDYEYEYNRKLNKEKYRTSKYKKNTKIAKNIATTAIGTIMIEEIVRRSLED